VVIKAADVTDSAQMSSLIAELRKTCPPIRGVLHAAMVLDDGLLRNMDAEQFQVPLAAKIQGAWHLHLLTQDLPLDFFILYSSATTYIGNPGQANYVAANVYLESLAAYRHSQGLPATCAAWGAIDDVGYLARHEDVKEALQSRLGGEALRSDSALEQLGLLMNQGRCCRAVIDLDWPVLERFLPASDSLRFEPLRRSSKRGGSDLDQADDLRALMDSHTQEEVVALLIDLVAEEVAQIMRLPKERIAPDRSLYDLGMDSLMAVELVVSLEKRFGIAIPVMALSQSPTMNRIAEIMTNHLYGDGTAAIEAQEVDVVSSLAKQHGVDSTVLESDEVSTGDA
jgi:acyl carrier protein